MFHRAESNLGSSGNLQTYLLMFGGWFVKAAGRKEGAAVNFAQGSAGAMTLP